jgi:hypothetical protein
VSEVLHSERLWPSPATWLVVPLAGAMVGVACLPFGTTAAVVGVLAGLAAVAGYLVSVSARVEVTTEGLRAGRAFVPARYLAGARAARGEQARQLRGPALDARTFLLLRGWVDAVVLVGLDDPADPTPSWLVSTRSPDAVVALVEQLVQSSAAGRTPAEEQEPASPEGPAPAAPPVARDGA